MTGEGSSSDPSHRRGRLVAKGGPRSQWGQLQGQPGLTAGRCADGAQHLPVARGPASSPRKRRSPHVTLPPGAPKGLHTGGAKPCAGDRHPASPSARPSGALRPLRCQGKSTVVEGPCRWRGVDSASRGHRRPSRGRRLGRPVRQVEQGAPPRGGGRLAALRWHEVGPGPAEEVRRLCGARPAPAERGLWILTVTGRDLTALFTAAEPFTEG